MKQKKNAVVVDDKIIKKIKNYMTEKELKFERRGYEDKVVFFGGFDGFDGVYTRFSFRLVVTAQHVISIITLPSDASTKKVQMAEFITRANYGLILGKFEMDFSDGEVRFQFAQLCSAVLSDSSKETLKAMFFLPPSMMKRYAPGMAKLLSDGSTTPEELVRQCETDDHA